MANVLLRKKIKDANLYQYEIADALGVSEPTFIRWLRRPLDEKTLSRVMGAIETAKSMKEDEENDEFRD